jgi:hypothetical protein
MTLPANQTDVWSKATQDDKIKALVLLSAMPAQATDEAGVDKAAYYIALDGVTRYGLAEAVKFILRGALGHAFFPNPAELRLQCDKSMEFHEMERRRIARREQMERERQEAAPRGEPTPEARARVAAIYAGFCAGYDKASAEDTLKLDPELVAQVPDNPKSPVHQRMGKAA